MKETLRRIMTVTSSKTEISTDEMGNRLVLRWGGGVTPPTPFLSRLLDRYLKKKIPLLSICHIRYGII
jgi:hypothetical protein